MDYGKFLYDIIRQPEGSVRWYGTKTDLVELVVIVAGMKVIRDYRGFPMSQEKLARAAFAAVGFPPPRYLTKIVQRIRYRVNPFPPLEKRIAPPVGLTLFKYINK